MELDQVAADLGVTVRHQRPLRGRWGEYDPLRHTITLHPSLAPVQYQYALGHELGHAYYRHHGCRPRQEWQADRFAATLLIRSNLWDTATLLHSTVEAVAHELQVHPRLVEAYWSRNQPIETRSAAL